MQDDYLYGFGFSGPHGGPFVAQGPDGMVLERSTLKGLKLAIEAYWVPAESIID